MDAFPLDEPAIYNWYDEAGNKIGKGKQIEITVNRSQRFTLEVIAEKDGYKDYDEVDIVVEDAIKSISPNPANDRIIIEYKLTESQRYAFLQIVNIQGVTVKEQTVTNATNWQTLSVSDLLPGSYTVNLIFKDVLIDTKTLIIK